MNTETEVEEVLDVVVTTPQKEEDFYCKKVSREESEQMYNESRLFILKSLDDESKNEKHTVFSRREKQIVDYYLTLESSNNAQERAYANTAKEIVGRVLENKILEKTNQNSKKRKSPSKNSVLDEIVEDKEVHSITDRQDIIIDICAKLGLKIFEYVENGETRYRGNGQFVSEKELGNLASKLRSYPFLAKVNDQNTLTEVSSGYKRTLQRLISTYLPIFAFPAYQSQ